MDNKEEPMTPGGSNSNSPLEEGRGCRSKRKQTDPSFCPVCSVTLRSSEVDSHLSSEIDKLQKISSNKPKQNGKNPLGSPSATNGTAESSVDNCWETYQKVKSNRHSRQKIKSRKRKADETVCPICNKETSEEITLHVEMCLRRTEENSGTESDENIDVEGFEEYEWAGQSRVRATSLLQTPMSSLGTVVTVAPDDDEDLVVDGDDSQRYGFPQYSERDMIFPESDNNTLRQMLIEQYDESAKTSDSEEKPAEQLEESKEDPIIAVLKKRISELEGREQCREVYKCLICMERYRTPVVSVSCWHVHCEQCWLQTLGAKKLCPQCNVITSPADLRRIYM